MGIEHTERYIPTEPGRDMRAGVTGARHGSQDQALSWIDTRAFRMASMAAIARSSVAT